MAEAADAGADALYTLRNAEGAVHALGLASCYVLDAPLMCALLDTVRDVCASKNAWYYRKLREASPPQWRVVFNEMVARCIAQRSHMLPAGRTAACPVLRAWDVDVDAGDVGERFSRARALFQDVLLPLSGDHDGPQQRHLISALVHEDARNVRPRRVRPPRFRANEAYLLDDGFWAAFGEHVVQAGGSVCEAVHEPVGRTHDDETCTHHDGDVDLFLHGLRTHQEAADVAENAVAYLLERVSAYNSLPRGGRTWHALVEMSPNAVNVTVVHETPGDHAYIPVARIQLVMRLFASIPQVLLYFDLAPARFAYDGKRVYATEGALYASANGAYPLEPALFSFPRRVYKYKSRGFWAVVPDSARFWRCYAMMCTRSSDDELRDALRAFNLASVLALQVLSVRRAASRARFLANATKDLLVSNEDDVEQPRYIVSGDCESRKSLLAMMMPCAEHASQCRCMPTLNRATAWMSDRSRLREQQEQLSLWTQWDVFAYCRNVARLRYTPCSPRFADAPQYAAALRDAGRWKLDAPLVNLANEDGADFLTARLQRSSGWAAPPSPKRARQA